MAPSGRHPQFSLYLGYANVQRLAPLYQDAAAKKDCGKARLIDSLVTSVDRDMHESMALGDSAQQIQSLVMLLEKDTPAAMKLAEAARAQGEVLIDHLFKRLTQAFGVLFLGVLVIVVASRWITGHFQRKALQR